MMLRAPANPLITVDPYFSVWSPSDRLTDSVTMHWTGKPHTILGVAEIDGVPYRFLGRLHAADDSPAMEQTDVQITALSTLYRFRAAGVTLSARFTSPLLPDDLPIMTRPVSYLEIAVASEDGAPHAVSVSVSASEELCLDYRGQDALRVEMLQESGIALGKIGSVSQPVLGRDGDDLRIDWGYFYLGVSARLGSVRAETREVPFMDKMPHGDDGKMIFLTAHAALATDKEDCVLFTFAYDDVASIDYFGAKLRSVWNAGGKTITEAITDAYADYAALLERARALD